MNKLMKFISHWPLVLKLLYVLLDFKINLTVYALVDSEAHVSAIAQNYLDKTKQ